MFIACEKKVDNSVQLTFEKNSQTVLKNLKDWEKEKMDYSQYAENFRMRGTMYGDSDSISLSEMMKSDKQIMEMFDFRIANDTIILLPGVNNDTKMMDGSVRHYTDWEVTRPATDSTEARTGLIKLYESFDFDADGKILYQQTYGDFTGIMMYLQGGDK
jgi:hypothetical protein